MRRTTTPIPGFNDDYQSQQTPSPIPFQALHLPGQARTSTIRPSYGLQTGFPPRVRENDLNPLDRHAPALQADQRLPAAAFSSRVAGVRGTLTGYSSDPEPRQSDAHFGNYGQALYADQQRELGHRTTVSDVPGGFHWSKPAPHNDHLVPLPPLGQRDRAGTTAFAAQYAPGPFPPHAQFPQSVIAQKGHDDYKAQQAEADNLQRELRQRGGRPTLDKLSKEARAQALPSLITDSGRLASESRQVAASRQSHLNDYASESWQAALPFSAAQSRAEPTWRGHEVQIREQNARATNAEAQEKKFGRMLSKLDPSTSASAMPDLDALSLSSTSGRKGKGRLAGSSAGSGGIQSGSSSSSAYRQPPPTGQPSAYDPFHTASATSGGLGGMPSTTPGLYGRQSRPSSPVYGGPLPRPSSPHLPMLTGQLSAPLYSSNPYPATLGRQRTASGFGGQTPALPSTSSSYGSRGLGEGSGASTRNRAYGAAPLSGGLGPGYPAGSSSAGTGFLSRRPSSSALRTPALDGQQSASAFPTTPSSGRFAGSSAMPSSYGVQNPYDMYDSYGQPRGRRPSTSGARPPFP